MLAGRVWVIFPSRCRAYSTSQRFQPVPTLPDTSLNTFRSHAFEPALPYLLPRDTFQHLPAIRKWFSHSSASSDVLALNRSYLARFGSTIVPLEISNADSFTRIEQSLSFFLECVHASSSTYITHRPSRYFSSFTPGVRTIKRTETTNDFFSAASLTPPTAKVYLAQAPMNDLPAGLREDVPTPQIVKSAGRGDVYDSSIWLGEAPTYTPLHRDPNPNLFVQLAGKKVVRLFRPEVGRAIFGKVQEEIGGEASATIRGEEMMQGSEKKVLEREVWGTGTIPEGMEAVLNSGGGLFIPQGWWHSVKGVGVGMTGSANWWFR